MRISDWSSDVCSSDLPELRGSSLEKVSLVHLGTHTAGGFPLQVPDSITNQRQLMRYFETWTPQYASGSARSYANLSIGLLGVITAKALGRSFTVEIGRASCRERVCQYV